MLQQEIMLPWKKTLRREDDWLTDKKSDVVRTTKKKSNVTNWLESGPLLFETTSRGINEVQGGGGEGTGGEGRYEGEGKVPGGTNYVKFSLAIIRVEASIFRKRQWSS